MRLRMPLGRDVMTIRSRDGPRDVYQCPKCHVFCSVCNLDKGCCLDRDQ